MSSRLVDLLCVTPAMGGGPGGAGCWVLVRMVEMIEDDGAQSSRVGGMNGRTDNQRNRQPTHRRPWGGVGEVCL